MSRPQPRQGSPAWADPASNLNMFDFPTASSASVNAFDPAVAAFADMSFSQPETNFAQPSDSHDKKRLKVETDTPTLDSIDYWAQFDSDPDKMGSFEIDYTQRPDNRLDKAFEPPGLGSRFYSTAPAPFRAEDFFDDSAFEQALSEEEDMFGSTSYTGQALNVENGQPREFFGPGLDKYQPGLRLAAVTPRLMKQDIMPSDSSPTKDRETTITSVSSDAGVDMTQPARKSSASKAVPRKTTAPGKVRSADRIAHNDVERKYRTNLKDKIAELRAAVPALHSTIEDAESEGGQASNSKVSKGTVLTKATEYIHQLEARNRTITEEHRQLMRRLQAFETLLNGAQRPDMVPNHSMTLFDPRGFC